MEPTPAELLLEEIDPVPTGLEEIDDLGPEAYDIVRQYFEESYATALLTAQEEVSLGQRIERGQKAKHQLSSTLMELDPELKNQLKLDVMDGKAARDHLILANTRLVISIAKRYLGLGLELLDLIQEGNIGLMTAVTKFDYHRGYKFSTYATWWIRQAVSRAVSDQGRTIRVPVHMNDRINVYRKTKDHLAQDLGRSPTVEELAQAMNLTPKQILNAIHANVDPLSLEDLVGDQEDTELQYFLEDENSPDPQQLTEASNLRTVLGQVVSQLNDREQQIIRLRFGLDPEYPDGLTLEEVGQMFRLTRERIRQIEFNALRKLRRRHVRAKLDGFQHH